MTCGHLKHTIKMQCLNCAAKYIIKQPSKEHQLSALDLWRRRWFKVCDWTIDDLRNEVRNLKFKGFP